MNRITNKHLEGMIVRLNRLTGSPVEYMTNGAINVGHYHLDCAYGGVELVCTVNESGGVSCPIGYGHVSKRELYERIHAFIRGIEITKE